MTASVFLALAFLPAQPNSAETVVRLTVQPMSAPKPALKYQLLPELRELTPGNPYQGYIKCFMEQRNFYFTKGAVSERMRILSMPLDQVAKELGDYPGNLRYADYAARLDTLDWQLTQRVQSEGLEFQAGELPALRALAIALQTRLRVQVANKKFTEAINGAKTMFKLARDLGEYPAPEANLFGIAIVNMALDTFEEMLQQPGCPNLYWALTDLPSPLVELRKGLQGHACLVNNEFKPLRDDVVMPEAELEKIVSRLSGTNGLAREQAGKPPKNWRAGVEARVKNSVAIYDARNRLIQAGGDKELVTKFPPLQIILLDEKTGYEILRDERMKLVSLSPQQIATLSEAESARARNGGWPIDDPMMMTNMLFQGKDAITSEDVPESFRPRFDRILQQLRITDGHLTRAKFEEYTKARVVAAATPRGELFVDLLPDTAALRKAQARLEQRLALFRHIEALRIQARPPVGKLPRKLADISLPLPNDPMTGKSFAYEVKDGVAHLRTTAPQGEEKNPEFNLHYEITIKN
jgi:hypothetical protein